MGVKNLWDILESCKKTLPLHHLQNRRVCVDLSCWMVQLQNVYKSHCPLKHRLYLMGLFHRLRALIALNCSLIFVTDGSIPAIKLASYRRRLNAGNNAISDRNSHEVSSIKRNMGSEFSCMIKEAKSLGVALGIPCLDGIEEAEAQCALLNSESLCDGCFTSDSDAFLFGARTVYRDICLGEGGYVVCYEMEDIERKLGFGRNSLIALAILLGSDYSQGIRGIGPESACQIVKSFGESCVLKRFASEGMSVVKKQKTYTKKGQSFTGGFKENCFDNMDINGSYCDSPMENQFLQVINAYMKPKCHSADSDTVHRVLALYPVNRTLLHQICAQFLEWSPEKTDEYILPKIAERNLRRFANLRSTSSELGVHLPIHEMPVKCPIISIVKQRKVQGRDYFEVSWEDFLKSSSVPVDLVESACPEKVLEFQQRKSQKQKPTGKTRKKKADMRTDLTEIDRKLQELVLDIENESTGVGNAVSLRGTIAENVPSSACVGTDDQMKHLNTEIECNSNLQTEVNNGRSLGSGSTAFEMEVIDLISPPPRPHVRKVSERHKAKCIDVIELSDAENDVSPEHARKARELRLFISKIRDEIPQV